MLIYDIETGPLPDEQLRAIWTPPDPPPHPGEFDEAAVRAGNLKDEAKIRAKFAAAKEEHDRRVAAYDDDCRAAADSAFAEFKSKAALDAVTGRVLAIGYLNADRKFVCSGGEERDILENFWSVSASMRDQKRSMIGLNTHDFDLPFMMRRSWILGVFVPSWVQREHRFFDRTFIDLRKVWLCGQSWSGSKSNFDHLGAAFGTGGKVDGITGGQFAELWESDRERAIEYLRNDLEQPLTWANAMGVC